MDLSRPGSTWPAQSRKQLSSVSVFQQGLRSLSSMRLSSSVNEVPLHDSTSDLSVTSSRFSPVKDDSALRKPSYRSVLRCTPIDCTESAFAHGRVADCRRLFNRRSSPVVPAASSRQIRQLPGNVKVFERKTDGARELDSIRKRGQHVEDAFGWYPSELDGQRLACRIPMSTRGCTRKDRRRAEHKNEHFAKEPVLAEQEGNAIQGPVRRS